MRYFFKYKGINSITKGISIVETPPITTCNVGKDGKLEPYEKELICRIDMSIADIDDISAWLTGEGDLELSWEPGKYFKAKPIGNIDYIVLVKKLRNFAIKFEIEPGSYLKEGNEKIVLTEKANLRNLGNTESDPIITIFGNGDINLVVAQQVMKLKGVNQSIILDTPLLEAYKGAELQNRNANGEFPILPLGEFSISWSGNVSKIEIIPNWRCL